MIVRIPAVSPPAFSLWYRSAVVALGLASVAAAAADGPGPRILLLTAGPRASIVVELDDETSKATAIEATDNRSVAVEIGPVRGKVGNQLLEAAKNSPLVREVRVGGITQGADGTVITILITAKAPVSGSVRRAQRRVYIDLEPRSARTATAQLPDKATPPAAPKPTPTTGTAPPRTKPAPAGIAPPAAAPTRAAATQPQPPAWPPAPREPAPAPAPQTPAGTTNAGVAPVTPAQSGTPPTVFAAPVLPKPSTAAGTFTTDAPPMTSTPGVRPSNAPAGAFDDVQRKAEQLAKVPDVKGLERLKTDLQSRRASAAASGASTAELDGLLGRFDQYLVEAQRNQLAADASLFRGGSGSTPGSVPDFQQSVRLLKPELESVMNALTGWSGGALPPANLQGVVASLLPRLRALKPPSTMAAAHSGMCQALDELALMWAKAAVEPPPEGTESAVIARARQSVDDFLRLERNLSAPANAGR